MFEAGSPYRDALIVFAGIAALLAIGLVLVSPGGIEFSESSENITGGAPLLSEGDALHYEIEGAIQTGRFSVKALGRDTQNSCFALTQESSQGNVTACYSAENGSVAYLAVDGGLVPLEALAGSPPIHAFEPWMLDAKEGWKAWIKSERKMKPGIIPLFEMSEAYITHYECVGKEEVLGRAAFKVEVKAFKESSSESGRTSRPLGSRTVWVDAEKRVLLKEEASAQGIESRCVIASAPFPLE